MAEQGIKAVIFIAYYLQNLEDGEISYQGMPKLLKE